MKEITLNNKEYLLVEIPFDTYDIRYKTMPDNTKQLVGTIKDNSGNIGTCYIRENPQGKLVGKISDILKDEDICHNLAYNELKSVGYVYLDWQQPDNEKRPYKFDNPSDSFTSYLQSINLDLTKQYLLIQKL